MEEVNLTEMEEARLTYSVRTHKNGWRYYTFEVFGLDSLTINTRLIVEEARRIPVSRVQADIIFEKAARNRGFQNNYEYIPFDRCDPGTTVGPDPEKDTQVEPPTQPLIIRFVPGEKVRLIVRINTSGALVTGKHHEYDRPNQPTEEPFTLNECDRPNRPTEEPFTLNLTVSQVRPETIIARVRSAVNFKGYRPTRPWFREPDKEIEHVGSALP